jgi:hypothetical protein
LKMRPHTANLVILVACLAIAVTFAKPAAQQDYSDEDEEDEAEDNNGGQFIEVPKFITSDSKVRVPLGRRLKLSCQTNNDLTPFSMIWKKPEDNKGAGMLSVGDTVVSTDTRIRVRSLDGNLGVELTIDDVEEGDEGRYECSLAINQPSPETVSFEVSVVERTSSGEQEVLSDTAAAVAEAEAEAGDGGGATNNGSLLAVVIVMASFAVTFQI